MGSQGSISEEEDISTEPCLGREYKDAFQAAGMSSKHQEWWTQSSEDQRGWKRFWKAHGECSRRQTGNGHAGCVVREFELCPKGNEEPWI